MSNRPEQLLGHVRRVLSRPPLASDSDAALLARFVGQQDEGAFAALVDRHGPMVLAVCRRALRDIHDAEDVFQATFLVLARKAARIRHPDTVAAWLHGTARRLALQCRRGEARRAKWETLSMAAASGKSPPDPLDELTARELLLLLDQELQRLPERYRAPLILCGLEGRTQEEAARLLRCTPGSVKGRLERGRARLHARLARRGLAPAVALSAALAARAVATGLPAGLAALAVRSLAAPVSARVLALAESALGSAVLPRLAAGLVLLLASALAGAGLAADWIPVPKPPEARPQTRPPALAAEEDPLPAHALARLGTTRFRQGPSVSGLTVSPDGSTIATLGDDQRVQLWDAATGRLLRQLAAPSRQLCSLCFAPDGQSLVLGGEDGVISLWDPATGADRGRLKGHQAAVCALTFTADGKTLLSGSADRTARVWDVAARKQVARFDGHETLVGVVAVSPDGTRAASCCGTRLPSLGFPDFSVWVWDVRTGKAMYRLTTHLEQVCAVAFTARGSEIATASLRRRGDIQLWDAASGKPLRVLAGQGGGVEQLTGCPDSPLLASVNDRGVGVWDVAAGKELWRQNARHPWSLAFGGGGKILAAGSIDGIIRLWEAKTGKELTADRPGHRGWVGALAFSPDGKLLASGSHDGSLRLWDVAARREVRRLAEHLMGVNSVAFAPDGKTVAMTAYSSPVIRLLRVADGHEIRLAPASSADVSCVAISPQGDLIASGGHDGVLRLRHWETGVERTRCEGHGNPILCVAFSPDGALLATGGQDGTVRLWDQRSGRERRRFATPSAIPFAVVFSPDGRTLAATGNDGIVRLWEVATGEERCRFRGVGERAALAFVRGGRVVVSAGRDSLIHFWDAAAAQELPPLRGHRGWAYALAVSPDGSTLASAGQDTTILLWSLARRSGDNP